MPSLNLFETQKKKNLKKILKKIPEKILVPEKKNTPE